MGSAIRLGRAHHGQRIPPSITPPPPLLSPDMRSSPPSFPRVLVGRRAGNTADGLAGRNAAHHLVQFFAHDAPPVRFFVAVSGVFAAQAHARTAHAGLLQVVERAVGVAGSHVAGVVHGAGGLRALRIGGRIRVMQVFVAQLDAESGEVGQCACF